MAKQPIWLFGYELKLIFFIICFLFSTTASVKSITPNIVAARKKKAEMMRCLKKGQRERNAFVMMSGYHSSQLRQEPQPSSISSICILKQCCHTDTVQIHPSGISIPQWSKIFLEVDHVKHRARYNVKHNFRKILHECVLTVRMLAITTLEL